MAAARPINVDRNSGIPSYVQIANHLKSEILSGRLPVGARLPPENELVDRAKLSRVTVRKGLEILENEGWVVRKQGLGTFVRSAISQELSSVQTITEVLLAKGITPRVKVLSFGAVRPPEKVRSAMRLNDKEQLLLVERLYMNGDEPIALLRTFLPLSFREEADLLRSEDAPPETTYTILEQRLGLQLKGASHSIRASKADRMAAAGLGLKVGDPVLVLDRVTYATDGRPLEYTMLHYHWQRYEFSVMVPRIAAQLA